MHGAKERGARTRLGLPRGRRADARRPQSRRQAPAFWELGGRRSTRAPEAHLVRQWCVCPSQAAPLTPGGAQGGWRRRRPA